MACRICGRGACTESFHSIQEQSDWQMKIGRYAPEDPPETPLEAETPTETEILDVE